MHIGFRVAAVCVCSTALGGVFGVIAAFGMRMGAVADIAMLFGAIAGLICSPVLVYALTHGPVLPGLAWIAIPTAAAAYLGGALTPPNGGPILGMAVAIGVYLLASYLRGLVGENRRRSQPVGVCASCAYSLDGLPRGAACPECGMQSTRNEHS